MVVAAVMDSKPELPAIFGEIDEIYKRIIKHELAIDAVRNVVRKGALSKEDEEHIMLVLNPSNISKKEMDAIGLTDQNLKNFRLPDRNIPALKGLVEKELNETFDLLQKLENATNTINNRDLDIASQAAELQKVSTATKDNVHKLYKHLKILLGLHTTNRTSCVKKQLEALTLNASEIASSSGESEATILKNIFHEATIDQLTFIKEDLEKELAAVDVQCDEKKKKLKKYEANEPQLLSLAATLAKLNEEIALKNMALRTLDDSSCTSFDPHGTPCKTPHTPRNSSLE